MKTVFLNWGIAIVSLYCLCECKETALSLSLSSTSLSLFLLLWTFLHVAESVSQQRKRERKRIEMYFFEATEIAKGWWRPVFFSFCFFYFSLSFLTLNWKGLITRVVSLDLSHLRAASGKAFWSFFLDTFFTTHSLDQATRDNFYNKQLFTSRPICQLIIERIIPERST